MTYNSSSQMACYTVTVVFVSFVCCLQAAVTPVTSPSIPLPSNAVVQSNEVAATTAVSPTPPVPTSVAGCACGVFLSGQFARGKPPVGYPSISAEFDDPISCNLAAGVKQCTTKCLDNLAKYLSKSTEIMCAAMDREVFRERAHLFVKNCNSGWVNTYLSAGREFCCKGGEYYKCPTV